MRVLILAYDFPPYVSVGGLRPYSWYRYLKESGVEPVVVTRQWANHYGDDRDYVAPSLTDRVEIDSSAFGTVIRAPHRPNISQRLLLRHGPRRFALVRKAVTACLEVAQYFAPVGPKAPLLDAAREYLRGHPVNAIVATGDPFVLFHYASELAREFAVPWVADYRDPWSQDRRRWRGSAPGWTTVLERKCVDSAAVLTTVTESLRDLLVSMHPGKRVEIIPNGFDPEAIAQAAGVAQGAERLTIALTGTVYPWHPVESVLRELEDFATRHIDPPIGLHLIGVGGRHGILDLLRRDYPVLAGNSTITHRLPNHEFTRELAKANAFLLFNNYAAPGTRIYEYLALRRRILLCYSEDPDALLLKKRHYFMDPLPGSDEHMLEGMVTRSHAGVVVAGPDHLRRVLLDMYAEFKSTHRVSCDSRDTTLYSRQAHAASLARILRGLLP